MNVLVTNCHEFTIKMRVLAKNRFQTVVLFNNFGEERRYNGDRSTPKSVVRPFPYWIRKIKRRIKRWDGQYLVYYHGKVHF